VPNQLNGTEHLIICLELLEDLRAQLLGEPDAAIVTAIKSISDVDRLESLGLRIVDQDVRDWKELLQNS